jgi:hypothetical protein
VGKPVCHYRCQVVLELRDLRPQRPSGEALVDLAARWTDLVA